MAQETFSIRLVLHGLLQAMLPGTLDSAAESIDGAGGVAESAGAGSAVKSPAKFLPLSHLTAQSARFGLWETIIYNPTANSRQYTYGKETRTSHHFQCRLVSAADPSQYVLGDSHGKGINAEKLKHLEEKFKPGLVFSMSKVVLAENMKQQYNSAPKSEIVSMINTTFSPMLVSVGKPKMPEPAIPVAASMGIGREQQFDALALIQQVSTIGNGGTTSSGQRRVRCTVTLIDGSKKDNDKLCLLPVTIFADERSGGEPPALFQELQLASSNKWAVAFFGIQGKKSESNDSTWSFSSSFSFHCQRASETTRGKELESKADELLGADAEAVPLAVLQSRGSDHNTNFEDMEAIETTCALFNTLLSKTQIKKIEDDTSFWQINWCKIYAPDKAAQITTNDGSRLWMQVKVEDETGHITIYMREKAALSLAATDTKDTFEAARADDSLEFPKKASIKIIRKSLGFETPTAADRTSPDDVVQHGIQCYIVEAAEQPIEDIPSKRSLELINLMKMTDPETDAGVHACISNIRKDPHYGLSVSYVVEDQIIYKNCTKAHALVIASKASESEHIGEGYQMITRDVKDALDETFRCTLMSYCTVKSSPDYQLKPARGQKTQMAFVTIVDVLEAGSGENPPMFLVDSLEKIPDNEAPCAPDTMRRLLYFASLTAKMQGTSSKRQWTEEMSPANAGKCRRLGKSPTDEALEKYKSSRILTSEAVLP